MTLQLPIAPGMSLGISTLYACEWRSPAHHAVAHAHPRRDTPPEAKGREILRHSRTIMVFESDAACPGLDTKGSSEVMSMRSSTKDS
jgi:hypothetical protein